MAKITIQGDEYTFKYGFRALLEHEKMTGTGFILGSNEGVLNFVYACLKAYNRDTFKMSMDDFIDAIDEDMSIMTQALEGVQELTDVGAYKSPEIEGGKNEKKS